jgi:hypothetical protein
MSSTNEGESKSRVGTVRGLCKTERPVTFLTDSLAYATVQQVIGNLSDTRQVLPTLTGK